MVVKQINKNRILTWFVTGGSSGVGKEVTEQLSKRGFNVISVARRKPSIVAKNVLALSMDASDPASVKKAVEQGINKFGKIDVVMNNIGISDLILFEDLTNKHCKEIMETNYYCAFNVLKELVPHFRKNMNGTIINNTSISGIAPRTYGTSYCSSKYALEGLTNVLWMETHNFCRVMAVELGWFKQTNILDKSKKITNNNTSYANIDFVHSKLPKYCDNNLHNAVNTIINVCCLERLPKKLILGKDAYKKFKTEHRYNRKSLSFSKRYLRFVSQYKIYLLKVISTKLLKFNS